MATLKALASSITAEAERLGNYIQKADLPDPSFAADGPTHFPIPADDAELQASRLRLLKAAEDMTALALGPVDTLRWQAWNVQYPPRVPRRMGIFREQADVQGSNTT